ncbi:MAG: hypothetical protein LBU39_12125 [Desulfobulbaceae bacterium]|nr:hypothetical protein [Desulfobulbaceae bacterium]
MGKQDDNQPAALRFDGGNALFKKPLMARPEEATVAEGIMNIYTVMGYDAVAVGVNDLAAGVELLKKNPKMPWLSANLVDDEGKRLFPASVTLTRGATRIGVIGLTGATPASQSGVRAADWRSPLAAEIKRLRDQCHVLVALSNLSAADNAKLVKDYSVIDLLITADAARDNVAPHPEQKPWVVQTMSQGKSLGILTIFTDEPSVSPTNWHIRAVTVPLKLTMPEDAAIANMVKNIQTAGAAR